MKTLRKLFEKAFRGRDRHPRKGKWRPWCSNIGATLVQARLEGRWKEKGVTA
jgi:hypothetical protein